MTKLATLGLKLSDVIAFEDLVDKGYCREVVTCTIQAGQGIGNVLHLVSGKYVWMQQSTHAAAVDPVVLIDVSKDISALTAGDYSLVVLKRGSAGVRTGGLSFKDALSGAEKLVVQGKFDAKGIVYRTTVG